MAVNLPRSILKLSKTLNLDILLFLGNYFKNMKNGSLQQIIFVSLLLLSFIISACMPVVGLPKLITKMEATNVNVYPQGLTTLTVIARDPEGGSLNYKWSCSAGNFESIAENSAIWKAPNQYGNFHILVVVENGKGLSEKATITIGVVVNNNPSTCPSCRN